MRICLVQIPIVLLLLIATDALPSSSDDSTHYWNATPIYNSLRIPLYEQYPVVDNFIFNQSVIFSQRGTIIGAAIGAAIGGIIDSRQSHIFIPATFVYGLIGSGAGFVAGTTSGILRGIKLQHSKEAGIETHSRRSRFGYEINGMTFGLTTYKGEGRISGIFQGDPGFALIYRPLTRKNGIPDRFSLAYTADWWGKGDYYNVDSYGRMSFTTIDTEIRYHFTDNTIFLPFWAVDAGYSWGIETEHIQVPDYNYVFNREEYRTVDRNEYDISSPHLRCIIGGEINMFDFMFADLKLGYEVVGPYLFARHRHYYSYGGNFLVNFSFGTFLF